jgi:hemerythrin superfamily protein
LLKKELPMSPAKPTRKPASFDALSMLMKDHKEVKTLFRDYDELVADGAPTVDREAVATEICEKLTAHATVEEELLYPPAREVLDDDEDLVDEALVEHATAKALIAQILDETPDDRFYDAKVKVLGEYITHHVKEEEGEMFPRIRKTDLDLNTLGMAIADRKEELMAGVVT